MRFCGVCFWKAHYKYLINNNIKNNNQRRYSWSRRKAADDQMSWWWPQILRRSVPPRKHWGMLRLQSMMTSIIRLSTIVIQMFLVWSDWITGVSGLPLNPCIWMPNHPLSVNHQGPATPVNVEYIITQGSWIQLNCWRIIRSNPCLTDR